MSGEKNLSRLLSQMDPKLNPGTYVFVSVDKLPNLDYQSVIGQFREAEGTTLILEREVAIANGLSYDFVASWITLQIHSSLEAIGLTAAFSHALAQGNISCNVISGYYHDHIFVKKEDESKALEVLTALAKHPI